MSVNYPANPVEPYRDRLETQSAETAHDEPFVPVYARRGKARGRQGKIKTWMILTPVAVVVLGGIGAMLITNGPEEAAAPLAEPAATPPVLSVAPTGTVAAPLSSASTPEPVVRDAAPLRPASPAPARRDAARTPASNPAAAPRVVTPAPAASTGPRAYTPAPAATSTLNMTPAAPRPTTVAPATPAPTPPPPIVVVEPVG